MTTKFKIGDMCYFQHHNRQYKVVGTVSGYVNRHLDSYNDIKVSNVITIYYGEKRKRHFPLTDKGTWKIEHHDLPVVPMDKETLDQLYTFEQEI